MHSHLVLPGAGLSRFHTGQLPSSPSLFRSALRSLSALPFALSVFLLFSFFFLFFLFFLRSTHRDPRSIPTPLLSYKSSSRSPPPLPDFVHSIQHSFRATTSSISARFLPSFLPFFLTIPFWKKNNVEIFIEFLIFFSVRKAELFVNYCFQVKRFLLSSIGFKIRILLVDFEFSIWFLNS